MKWIIGITLCTFFVIQGKAAHIIGGEMYYECLGGDEYEVRLILYRDCQSGGAVFDSNGGENGIQATVTVYRGNEREPFIRTLELGRPTVTDIEANLGDPCLEVPPGICVEQGEYVFRVTLPRSTETYTIVYQRCCRNPTITNILTPGEIGATWFVNINPAAQARCNSSIQFSNVPTVAICGGEILSFDHSAFDPDNTPNTTITYSFCSPLQGGGLEGSSGNGDAEGPNGVAPNPDTRPPYSPVTFVGGEFSAATPMGTNSLISIDPITGVISGRPRNLGQYVVGVCATERDRNGTILSEIRRDFQFNVVRCENTIQAVIQSDSIAGDTFYIINCADTEIELTDESRGQQIISTRDWYFPDLGDSLIAEGAQQRFQFPSPGSYEGTLIINQNSFCTDTAFLQVIIHDTLGADMSYTYDTCDAGPVRFQATDFSNNGNIVSRSWFIDSDITYQVQQFEHIYRNPGVKNIRYTVVDEVGCEYVVNGQFPYYPIPNDIAVDIRGNRCQPSVLLFDNQSFPLDTSYDVYWDFGDGNNSTEISPTHTYVDTGTYRIYLSLLSPIGCFYEGTLDETVQVVISPKAGFYLREPDLSQFRMQTEVIDTSERTEFWRYQLDRRFIENQPNFALSFPDTGVYLLTQIVERTNGCKDTATAVVDIIPKTTYFLPNAFSPNGDGVNDFYAGQGDFIGMKDFSMKIFNRSGELVFQSTDPNLGWNGAYKNSGIKMAQDVYVCLVHYRTARGKPIDLHSKVLLLAK